MDTSDANLRIPITPLQADEIGAFFEQDARGFGERMSKVVSDLIESELEPELVLVSRDEGEIVGGVASVLSQMTLPGLSQAPTAMVVGVSVTPTHRRQGRLKALMRQQLDDLKSRDQTFAALYASEGGIYGRFGYGQATFGSSYVLDKRTARVEPKHLDRCEGRVRMVSREQAAEAFPAVYSAYSTTRAGELQRPKAVFHLDSLGELGSEEMERRFFAVYERAGAIEGYAAYEIVKDDSPPQRQRRVVLHELCCLDLAAYVAFWNFLLEIDLTVEVVAQGRPVDEPIRWLLNDPRQLRTMRSGDRTWVRLIDVAECLRARSYPVAGSLVVGVRDEFCEWNTGSYLIEVADEGAPAEVTRTDRAPEVEVGVSTLASVFMGGVDLVTFAAVGLARVESEASLRLGSRLFGDERPPYSLTDF